MFYIVLCVNHVKNQMVSSNRTNIHWKRVHLGQGANHFKLIFRHSFFGKSITQNLVFLWICRYCPLVLVFWWNSIPSFWSKNESRFLTLQHTIEAWVSLRRVTFVSNNRNRLSHGPYESSAVKCMAHKCVQHHDKFPTAK